MRKSKIFNFNYTNILLTLSLSIISFFLEIQTTYSWVCPDEIYYDFYCQKCSSDGTRCEQCVKGYYYDIYTGRCTRCDQNTFFEDWPLCTECAEATFRFGENCTHCEEGCKVCTGLGAENCKILYNGYYYNSVNNTIDSCGEQCDICENKEICLKCKYDNYCLKGEECVLSGINGCEICGKNFNTCDKCKEGFYMIDDRCVYCQLPCIKCEDDFVCTECLEGYYVNKGECLKNEEDD